MPRNRFVVAESVRYELSDGDWVEFKKRLTFGENQRLAGRVLRQTAPIGQPRAEETWLDMEGFVTQRLAAWISAWSLPKPPTLANIFALDQDSGQELDSALDKHLEAMDAEKNAMTPPSSAS
uniref:Tail assembly chaperone n=1 Tax=viral metagenome TaxID=1070528 RepID=A0A6M3JBH5_9ZZZZ